ncbi:hypothetical protein I552_5573 [Mycobacterium xenopi 3993]|nr:hypothetical protein I552_5573 [Mycobacterium xenopi 3993]
MDRVRTLYHYPGAAFVNRRRDCAYSRRGDARVAGHRRMRRVSLLVDRQSGRCIATSAWESDEAMHASAERIQPIRDRAAQMFGGPRRSRSGRSRPCIATIAHARAHARG